ncbi:MAG: hypothetical protein WKF84_08330 [Pyrinomonadaceae bacterium]
MTKSQDIYQEKKTSSDLWVTVKPFVRKVQSEIGVLIVDDSIEEKPYTDENDIVCWHYDHSKERHVKGINFVTALYYAKKFLFPLAFIWLPKQKLILTRRPRRETSKPCYKEPSCA